MTDDCRRDLALLATEWFKCARRAMRLAQDAAPTRSERERSQLAYSSGRVREALANHDLVMHEFDGQPYSPSLPVEPVNPEDFDTEEGLLVAETVEPTLILEGRILMRGRVVLTRAA